MAGKIKVSAPRLNPHICYIPRDYEEKIECIKERTKLSLYQLLCTCSHRELSTTEQIKEFKSALRKEEFKNIGEWAVALIDFLYSIKEDLEFTDLTSVKVKKGNTKSDINSSRF